MLQYRIRIGGKTKEELILELENKKIQVWRDAKELIKSNYFNSSVDHKVSDLIILAVKDLGICSGVTMEEIYKKAKLFGLELCSAETAPYFRLSYSGSEPVYVAMEQIADTSGKFKVFYMYEDIDGIDIKASLRTYCPKSPSFRRPAQRLSSGSKFVFCLNKLN